MAMNRYTESFELQEGGDAATQLSTLSITGINPQ